MLKNIALCFSGGGYRAAGFSLGILSYLDHFKIKDTETDLAISLLDNVNGLSTVSGGTITGVMYTYFRANERYFEEFYAFFYEFMDKDLLLDLALKKLEDKDNTVWNNTFKKKSLINAFALAYRDLFLLDPEDTFKSLYPATASIKDFCFNATEFTYGLAFRFQNEGDFGNYHYRDKTGLQSHKGDFHVADIIASSSCFPLGFEPLTMPHDYFKKDSLAYNQLVQDADFRAGVGIMDGGIVDNQGMGSTMLADQRNREKGTTAYYDLILNCDVGTGYIDPWKPEPTATGTSETINQLWGKIGNFVANNFIAWLLVIIGLGSIIAGSCYSCCYGKWGIFIGTVLLLLGILLFVIKGAIGYTLKFIENKIKLAIPEFYIPKLKSFDDIGVGTLKRMVLERLTSGANMVNYVFLNQVRRLNYDLFYKSKNLEGRRATAIINALTKKRYTENTTVNENDNTTTKKEKELLNTIPKPSKKMFDSAEIAASFGTTLWFEKKDKDIRTLDNLIACGQFTACYTLLVYILKTEKKQKQPNAQLETIKEALLKDWDAFNEDPFVLVKKRK
ncbi:hypothetical protein NBRC110019_16170 [Neptunitalea chrysea]|uniref:PNPLA domain-containing protein n=1 Tax=Neptunitalea chrysea TaxID=1647581 RepID=A0A9W6B667_9FLAO|nr:patatin-like phospholipase family protein [Neptunitalea chrysea]GLB52577.1 hypothetical protein NBRC110019_16170 [Neptunitalea chrysea]